MAETWQVFVFVFLLFVQGITLKFAYHHTNEYKEDLSNVSQQALEKKTKICSFPLFSMNKAYSHFSFFNTWK